MSKFGLFLLLVTAWIVLSGCSQYTQPGNSEKVGSGSGSNPPSLENELDQPGLDVADVEINLLPEEEPPASGELQFSTDFSKHTVPYSEIFSGGPPKDGIPSIDTPSFIRVEQADQWLRPEEPVLAVVAEGTPKAYPIQILVWHEIVNDVIGTQPVTVTFCPLCNTGIAFDRQFKGEILDFGTTGRLRYSNLIMYDRQTETWWQQATGEAIAGEHAGKQLDLIPIAMISWAEFRQTYPDGLILSRDTGYNRSYGDNPYPGYDNINSSPFLFRGPQTPGILPAMARVLTIDMGGEAVAYPFDVLKEIQVINDKVAGSEVLIIWSPEAASAFEPRFELPQSGGGVEWEEEIEEQYSSSDNPAINFVGSANAFNRVVNGQVLTFQLVGSRIVDQQTGSVWNIFGIAESGPLEGEQLTPLTAINHFWFSWAAFKPDTRIYQP